MDGSALSQNNKTERVILCETSVCGVVSEVIPRRNPRSVGEDGNAWRDLPNRVAYGTALVCCRETFFPRRATSRTTALLTCSAFSRDFVSCQTFHTLAYHSLPVTAVASPPFYP